MNLFLKAGEAKWMEALNNVRDAPGWQVMHFHLDALLEQYQSDYQIKIAVNMINDLLKHAEGGVFLLSDHSIVVLCNRLDASIQNKLIFQLRYLYMDDPLAYNADGQENMEFCTLYDLKRDWKECHDLCARKLNTLRKPAIREVKKNTAGLPPAAPASPATPLPLTRSSRLDASGLAIIERDLQHADLSLAIRKQPVCAAMRGGQVRRVFDELYIHIAHLRQTLKHDIDFLSNRWLFKYLTQVLDARMLEMICRQPARYLDAPVSINLNAETLLSARFAEFDAAIDPSIKISIVIEVPVVDVFADMTGFILARREAQRLGYRVCLDGLTTLSFIQLDREKLGVDLLKMQWNADMESDLNTKDNIRLAASVQASGTNRIILCRCDDKQAVDYGQALGISLFQERYIDHVINPEAKIKN